MNESIYSTIFYLMSNHKTRSLKVLALQVQSKSINFAQVVQDAMLLLCSGHMASVQSEAQITKAKQTSAKLKKALIDRARFSAEITFLASPVTGGGIARTAFNNSCY
jgi:hypothetical protein